MSGYAEIPEGQYTKTVYGLIKEKKYDEVVRILSIELQGLPRSRAALSLLGYCYYMMQDFESAVAMYDQLCKLHPEVEEYKLYKAQSLHKSGNYAEAVSSDFPQRSVCQASRPSRYTAMFTRT